MSTDRRIQALETMVTSLMAAVSEIQPATPPAEAPSNHTCPTCTRLRDAVTQRTSTVLPDFEQAVSDLKRELLSAALARNNDVMKYAAESIGLKYTTFVEMANRLGVVASRRRGGAKLPRGETLPAARRRDAAPVTLALPGHATGRRVA